MTPRTQFHLSRDRLSNLGCFCFDSGASRILTQRFFHYYSTPTVPLSCIFLFQSETFIAGLIISVSLSACVCQPRKKEEQTSEPIKNPKKEVYNVLRTIKWRNTVFSSL